MSDFSKPLNNDQPAIDLPPVFSRYQFAIGNALRTELDGRALPIYETLRYYMGWAESDGTRIHGPEGKRLRPTLCLLACEAVGGNPEDALPVAVAIELAHNFSLIHDDIEDGDTTRHHRPTLWVIWGAPTAIVAGNNLLALSDIAIQRLREAGVATAVTAGHILTERYLSMMEGQYLDISYEGRTDVTVHDYLAMIERKTGALIEGSMELGALVGAGKSDQIVEGLRAIGDDFGRIFQIRDDILGIWGGPALGKPIGSDITRKKNSLPVVHVLEQAPEVERSELQRIYAEEAISPNAVDRVLNLMDGVGTHRWCQEQAEARWIRARERIGSLKLSHDASRELLELGEYLLVREA